MTDLVIETHGLTRYFGKKCVVNQLDLHVPRGSIFAFLGRNGAGKSTTIRMLLGLVEPTRGGATILGYDSTDLTPEAKARIGYMSEGHHVYDWMSVRQCRDFQAAFYKHWNDEIFQGVIEHFKLDPKAIAGNLSRGQRAGLCLALTLAPEPELLILDDPALGLDPVARRGLLQSMLFVTRRADRTILFSSHILADVERVADYLAVIDGGVLRANCSVETFRSRVRQVVLTYAGDAPDLMAPLAGDAVRRDAPSGRPYEAADRPALPGLLHAARDGHELTLTFANFDDDTEALLDTLGAIHIEPIPLSLEDALVNYFGEQREASFFLRDTPGEEMAA